MKSVTEMFREQTILLNEKYGIPIVDIASLFEKVLSPNGYISDDGVNISAEVFFSIDGMYPSEIGQALIANEVFKTINESYKTKIPLISIRSFMD